MQNMFAGIFFLLLVFNNVYGHSYHLGACPNIEPEPDFNIKKVSIMCLIITFLRILY